MRGTTAPACKLCHEPLVSMSSDIWETCVGYFSPPGHDHDDNCMSRSARCAAGHPNTLSIRRACPACTWRGRDECRTCGDRKLDAWPELPYTTETP
jgi:hypothetical protein